MYDTIDVDREGNPLTYMDVLAGEDNMTEEIDTALCGRQAVALVERVLDERERQIIRMRGAEIHASGLPDSSGAEQQLLGQSCFSRVYMGKNTNVS